MAVVVADTGPLISLESVAGGFGFLRRMTDRVLMPEAVLLEAGARLPDPSSYLAVHQIQDLVEVVHVDDVARVQMLPGGRPLHRGELEAITLAWDRGLPILLEDADARKVAKMLGLRFVGIGGLVLAAFRHQVVDRAEALRMLHALMESKRLPRNLHGALVSEIVGGKEQDFGSR